MAPRLVMAVGWCRCGQHTNNAAHAVTDAEHLAHARLLAHELRVRARTAVGRRHQPRAQRGAQLADGGGARVVGGSEGCAGGCRATIETIHATCSAAILAAVSASSAAASDAPASRWASAAASSAGATSVSARCACSLASAA